MCACDIFVREVAPTNELVGGARSRRSAIVVFLCCSREPQVNICQNTKDKELQGKLMNAHKSVGVLIGLLALPRIALRVATKIPKPLPAPAWQHVGAQVGHAALYGVMVFMPASGLVMGYYSGKGVPFFGTTIPGAATPNGPVAKSAWEVCLCVCVCVACCFAIFA